MPGGSGLLELGMSRSFLERSRPVPKFPLMGLCGVVLASAYPTFASPTWKIHDLRNLPGKEAVVILVDRIGNKWIGTHGGLAELTRAGDWKLFNRGNTGGYLRSDSITALATDANDNIWVGTRNGGLSVFGAGVWQNFTFTSTHGGLPDDRITGISVAAGKDVWVGTQNGFAKLSGSSWTTYSGDKVSGRLPNRIVTAIAAEGKTDIWIGTIAGLVRFNGSAWLQFTKASTNGGLPHNSITSISVSPAGVKWVGTYRGLGRLSGGSWTGLSEGDPVELRDAQIFRVHSDPSEGCWIAFKGGAAHWDGQSWRLFTKSNTGGGVPTIFVNSVLPEENGNVWFATHEGLSQYIP